MKEKFSLAFNPAISSSCGLLRVTVLREQQQQIIVCRSFLRVTDLVDAVCLRSGSASPKFVRKWLIGFSIQDLEGR